MFGVQELCLFVCCFHLVLVLPPSAEGRRFIRAAEAWMPSDMALNFPSHLQSVWMCVYVFVCALLAVYTWCMWILHMWTLTAIRLPLSCNLYGNLWNFGLCVYMCVYVCVCISLAQVAPLPASNLNTHTHNTQKYTQYTYKVTPMNCTFLQMIRLRKKTLQSPNCG